MSAKSRLNFDIQGRIGCGNALLGSTTGELFMCNLTGKSRYISDDARRKSRDKWVFSGIKGALCFLCDNSGVYHFKIFRQQDLKELFSISLESSTEYLKLTEHFFYFESYEGLIGFNIVDKLEANTFSNIIVGKLEQVKKRRESKSKSKKQRKGSKVGFNFFGQGKSRGGGGSKRGKKKKKKTELLSISDLTPEWKKFFKESGIRKKDFKKAKVQKLIRSVLEQGNISATPPPTDLTEKQAKEYYPEERDYKRYQNYKHATLKYEKEVEKYENELKNFNKELYRSSKSLVVMPTGGGKRELPVPPPRPPRQMKRPAPEFSLEQPEFPALPLIDRVEQELDDFLDDDKFSRVASMREAEKSKVSSLPPPPKEIQRLKVTGERRNTEPLKEKKVVLDLGLEERKQVRKRSEEENKTFSVLIKKQKKALAHVSRLPDLSTVRQRDDNLLGTLMRKLKSRRDELVSNEEEGDSDWSDLD